MPTYDYLCTQCEHTWEACYCIAERNTPLTAACPQCATVDTVVKVAAAPGVGYTTESLHKKTPEGFKDLLRHMKTKHRGNTINV